MHCISIADLAGLVSEHAPALIYRGAHIKSTSLSTYWVSSRNRFDRWHQSMARYKRLEREGNPLALKCWWQDNLPVLEEVIVSEMLTRTVAALGATLDAAHKTDDVSPVTSAIHLSNLDASNRVQRMLIAGQGNRVHESVRLNRLRKGVERWTDMLLGRMASGSQEFLKFAFDRVRADSHATEARELGIQASTTSMWLIQASMRQMLQQRLSSEAAFPHCNRAVADSVLGLFSADLFHDSGTLKSKFFHMIDRDHQHDSQALRPESFEAFADEMAQDDEYDVAASDLQRWDLK